MSTYTVTEIAPLGYGNPEAKISYAKKIENGEFTPEVVEKGAEFIQDGLCMVDVTEPDDGCIDGRLTTHVLVPTGTDTFDFDDIETHGVTSHNRYKVAGGGYITSLVMKLALDPEVETIDEDLEGVAHHLTRLGIYCGTHSGDHTQNPGSIDCGANDKFEEILRTGHKFKDNIKYTIQTVLSQFDLGVKFDEAVADRAEAGLAGTFSHKGYFSGSNGRNRFEIIMHNIAEAQKAIGSERAVSVSKHLGGNHNEAFIVLNTVAGKTFSQAKLQERMSQFFPNRNPVTMAQTFIVDIPRIVELAKAMAKGRDNEDDAFKVALYAGIAFQFATAAELTDGTLRRFVVQ